MLFSVNYPTKSILFKIVIAFDSTHSTVMYLTAGKVTLVYNSAKALKLHYNLSRKSFQYIELNSGHFDDHCISSTRYLQESTYRQDKNGELWH